jgi:arylsulfatase A-like enzyme
VRLVTALPGLLALPLLLGGCTLTGSEGPSEPGRPNVILISVDTLRADRLNLYGYDRYPTSPLIDALSRDGIVHEAHIASAPWTIPSHLSLLTSLHPSSHGVTKSVDSWVLAGDEATSRYVRLPDSRVTLAETLAAAGYRTAAFTGGVTLDARIGFGQGFELYDTSMYKIGPSQMESMLEWVGSEPGRPFFLFWHTFEVHAPYTRGRFLAPEHAGLRIDLDRLTERIIRDPVVAATVASSEVVRDFLDRNSALDVETCSDLYDGGVATVDFWVGRLVGYLLDHGLYDSTAIVLTSDHGEELGDHDPEAFYDIHGRTNYEEMLRVPLIVKLPGSALAGTRVDSVTSAVDVMPTVLEVAGVSAPGGQMQGHSLVGLWEGTGGAGRVAFAEAAAYRPEVKSVRSARYKLILDIAPETVEEHGRAFVPEVPRGRRLFDLASDPRELHDLLAEDAGADVEDIAAGLEKRLRAFASAAPGDVEEVELDSEAIDRLRAMGYVR